MAGVRVVGLIGECGTGIEQSRKAFPSYCVPPATRTQGLTGGEGLEELAGQRGEDSRASWQWGNGPCLGCVSSLRPSASQTSCSSPAGTGVSLYLVEEASLC